ncbi:unnamed protein product [Dovyalis caffra]|uniref:F-box domain-containing protein n=1 Tax=Dovyalis caffra TaxID=77055 RepID=A0AAV1SX67_9ROSI|nr:unnamed protein product [Dovyalis caffra]
METIVNNEDLLTEILILLPIKSLLKFMSVSKHWLALISSYPFSIRRSSNLNSVGAVLVQVDKTPHFRLLNLDSSNSDSLAANFFASNKPFSKTKILQSCNGLLLCCDDSPPPKYFHRFYIKKDDIYTSKKYCVWNPTSKKYTLLPPLLPLPCSLRGILFLRGITLAFDPSKSLEYKVVAVCQCVLFENCYQIQIYSSKARTWRVSVRSFNPQYPVDFLRGVFYNGTIHWGSDVGCFRKIWSVSDLCFRSEDWSGSNLYFDIDQEKLKTLQMPRVRARASCESSLVNCFEVSGGGRLLLVRKYKTASDPQIDVYQLHRDFSGWFLKYRLDLPDRFDEYRNVLFVGSGNDKDSLILVDANWLSIIRKYNLKDKSFEGSNIGWFNLRSAYYSNNLKAKVLHYIESLACV